MNLLRAIVRLRAAIVLLILTSSFSSCVVNSRSGAEQRPSPGTSTTVTATTARPEYDAAGWYREHDEDPEPHSLLVESLSPGRVIASHNADKLFNPASVIKLATSLVALKKLGPDYRFRINVYADGRVDDRGVFEGQLYVMGGAPTFGDVGANMIAKELREMGIKRVTGTINVSPDFCFNFSESAEESAERLVKALKLENPQPKTAVTDAPAGDLLFVFNSHPLREVLLYMNAHSSNFTAERVGALLGGAAGVEQFLTGELQIPREQISLATVSGREQNRMNAQGILKVMRALVDEARRQGLEPVDIMPVADEDSGTLRRRFKDTALEGAVLGKTGTLTPDVDGGMVALAGIVYTEDAGELVFVTLDQGDRLSENRDMEDKLLEEVIMTRTRPRPVPREMPRDLLSTSSMNIERRAAVQKKRKAA